MSYICSFTFPDGWVLSLRALYCQATHAHHLEGPQTRRTNDRRLRKMVDKASALFGSTPVHLVEPTRTVGRAIYGYEFEGEPVLRESLPPVCCIGDFEADAVPGADGCASGLVVGWFQSEPPPVPIEPDLVNLFFNIRWDDLAANYWP